MEEPPQEQEFRVWNTTTKMIVGVIAFVLFCVALYAFRVVLIPLIIGMLLGYIMYPFACFVRDRTPIPHGLATGLLYLLLLAIIIPVVLLALQGMGRQVEAGRSFLVQVLRDANAMSPGTTVEIIGFEIGVEELTTEITNTLTGFIREGATSAFEVALGISETILLVVFTLLIGFYVTRDGDKFVRWLTELIPDQYERDGVRLMKQINVIWSAFLRGYLLLAIVVATLMTFVSSLIGLPRPVLMGVLAGLLEFLPSVGHAIWLLIAVIVAGIEGSTTFPVNNLVFVLIVVGVYIVYTQFDLNYLIPRIIGSQVHLHPMVVIMGIIIGANIGGVIGIALAAPVIATIRVIGRYVYARLFDQNPFPDEPPEPTETELHMPETGTAQVPESAVPH